MLTPAQELIALDLLAQGVRPADIFRQLGVKRADVYHLRERVRSDVPPPAPRPVEIIDAPTLAEAVAYAIRHGIREWDWEPAQSRRPEATRAVPGTREKVEVLAARVAKGSPLWCEDDGMRSGE